MKFTDLNTDGAPCLENGEGLLGEMQVIKVTYDTKRAGNFTKTVTVTSNAKTPTKVLTIKGKVEPAATEEAFPSNGKKDDGATPLEKH